MPKKRKPGEQLTDSMYYVLLALSEPLHGYAIMKRVAEISNKNVLLTTVTLYTTLSIHEYDGFIRKREDIIYEKDERRKYYEITEEGKEVARKECIRRKKTYLDGLKALKEMGVLIDDND